MKQIFLIYLLLIIFILSKKEPNNVTSETNQKNNNENKEQETHDENFYKGIVPNGKIYELNDYIFDVVVQQGNIYRWFLILYSKTCGYCRRARNQISKLFLEYKNNDTIRFGEIEVGDNIMTHIRFNINGVPYIILVENNTIYEMDLYPNYENLKKFVSTDFNDVKNETKIFPTPVKFYYVAWKMFCQSVQGLIEKINNFLKRKFGLNIKLTPIVIVIIVVSTILGCCVCNYYLCVKCCFNDDFEKEINELQKYYENKRKKKNKQKNDEANEKEEGEEEENHEGEEAEYQEGEEIEDEEGEEIEDEEGEEIEDEEKELTEEEKKKLEEDKKEKERKKKEEEERIKKEEEERKKKEEEEKKVKKGKKKNKKKKE